MVEQKRRWFDTTINLQTILTALLGAAVSLTIAYFAVVQRVALVEQDVSTLKTAQKDGITEIKGSVKDTNDKIDRLTAFLLNSSAGQRPEMQRWSK